MNPHSIRQSAFTFLPQGAIIQEFKVAGHNIVQAFPDAHLYQTHNEAYFGETIGRTTNRVQDAKLHNLNGAKTYHLAANSEPNCLHGGTQGWGKQPFEGPLHLSRHGRDAVQFTHRSPDRDEGYPGTVECRVWYTESVEAGKTVLEVEYEVELVEDDCDETVVGVTNHR